MNKDIDLISRLLDEHYPQEHPTLDFLVCICGDHDFRTESFNDHVASNLVSNGVRIMPPSIREVSEKHGIPLVYHDLPIEIVRPAPFEADSERNDMTEYRKAMHRGFPDTQDPERLDGWNLRWLKEQKFEEKLIHPSYIDTLMKPKKSPY